MTSPVFFYHQKVLTFITCYFKWLLSITRWKTSATFCYYFRKWVLKWCTLDVVQILFSLQMENHGRLPGQEEVKLLKCWCELKVVLVNVQYILQTNGICQWFTFPFLHQHDTMVTRIFNSENTNGPSTPVKLHHLLGIYTHFHWHLWPLHTSLELQLMYYCLQEVDAWKKGPR